MIEDYIFNDDDDDGREINLINNYEEKEKEKEKENNNNKIELFHIDIQSIKKKKGKYHKIQNFFKTNFITDNKRKRRKRKKRKRKRRKRKRKGKYSKNESTNKRI